MKKIIRLTESDLVRLSKRVIKEQQDETQNKLWGDIQTLIKTYLNNEGSNDYDKTLGLITFLESNLKQLKLKLDPTPKTRQDRVYAAALDYLETKYGTLEKGDGRDYQYVFSFPNTNPDDYEHNLMGMRGQSRILWVSDKMMSQILKSNPFGYDKGTWLSLIGDWADKKYNLDIHDRVKYRSPIQSIK